MGTTAVAKTDDHAVKLWASKLFKEAGKQFFFTKWMGEDEDNIIQVKNDLTKEPGDKITITLVMDLSGTGQSSQTTIAIEGNEEALAFYNFAVEITEYGHGVRADGKLTMKRTAFPMKLTMNGALAKWTKNKMEDLLVTAMSASPTTSREINTLSGEPTSGQVMSTSLISQAKRLAQLSAPKIMPINYLGDEWYMMLIHPYQYKALRAETAWINAQRDANVRSMRENPLFSGAAGFWDKVALFEYDRVVLSSGNEARSLLMGKQAGVLAWGQQPGWYEKDFDYYRIPGVATDFILGAYKTVFNNQDFGVVTLDTLYIPDS